MNILCYGDSNTWGFPPGDGRRFDDETRWPAGRSRRFLPPAHRQIRMFLRRVPQNSRDLRNGHHRHKQHYFGKPEGRRAHRGRGTSETGKRAVCIYQRTVFIAVISVISINEPETTCKPLV